jgi:AbrB family looped-hinge helix DNA binding protein
MSQATLTSKGQITIPIAVRKQLELKAGDRIDFILNDSGEAVLRRVSRSTDEVKGMLAHRGHAPKTIEQMDEAVRQKFRSERA